MLGELNGEAGDAAGAALNQDRLAALELQRVFHRIHRSEAGQRQGGGVHVRQTVRLLGDDRGLDRELFAIGAFPPGIEHAKYRVADGEIDAAAGGADHAGKVPARNLPEI